MPYIEIEKVKEVREALKTAFPNMRFSIRREHSTVLHVVLLKGPELLKPVDGHSYDVNHFWVTDHYSGSKRDLLHSILTKIDMVAPLEIESVDGDYGNIPTYYLRFSVGKWNKPYEVMQ